jgi:hypothetical protein
MAINENQIRDDITKQIQNEIAQQRNSINNGLAIQKRQYDDTINRNNQYLDEQIKGLNTSRIVNDDKITALQNRRGGFYSGGLDYQLAENLRNTTNSQNTIRRDINDKNQSILGEYNTLAGQAAEQIRQLETQAPDRIRQLVNEELTRRRAEEFEREKFEWQKQMEQQQLAASRARASSSSSGGSSSSTSSGPKSKDQSFNDWVGYFQQQANAINNRGLFRFEDDLRNNQSMVNSITSQGYNLNAVIDALYAGATGKTKAQYTAEWEKNLAKQGHAQGGRRVQ